MTLQKTKETSIIVTLVRSNSQVQYETSIDVFSLLTEAS